jgi:hypothetical protein
MEEELKDMIEWQEVRARPLNNLSSSPRLDSKVQRCSLVMRKTMPNSHASTGVVFT